MFISVSLPKKEDVIMDVEEMVLEDSSSDMSESKKSVDSAIIFNEQGIDEKNEKKDEKDKNV